MIQFFFFFLTYKMFKLNNFRLTKILLNDSMMRIYDVCIDMKKMVDELGREGIAALVSYSV